MTREGAVEVNAATGKKKRISKRIRDADFAKTEAPPQPEQAAQPLPGGATSPPLTDTPPLPHAPGAEREQDTAAAERVLERIDGARTRKASKKAARKAQAEATAKEKSSRLQFTDEERATPELERYIRKSDKAADRLDAAKAAIPKEKKLVRERTFDEATGKGKTRLHFEEQEKPIGKNKPHNNPLSRPAQEAGIWQILSASIKESLGKFNAVPSIDFDTEDMPDIPAFEQNLPPAPPKVHFNSDFNPFKPSSSSGGGNYSRPKVDWEDLYGGLEKASKMNQPFSDSDPESEEFAVIEEESIATAAPETLYAGEPAVIEKGTQHLQFKGRFILTSVKSGLM